MSLRLLLKGPPLQTVEKRNAFLTIGKTWLVSWQGTNIVGMKDESLRWSTSASWVELGRKWLDQFCAELGSISNKLGQSRPGIIRPNLTKIGPNSTAVGRDSAKFGSTWPGIAKQRVDFGCRVGRIWTGLDQIAADIHRIWTELDRCLPELGRTGATRATVTLERF